jgi:hypothetical protein
MSLNMQLSWGVDQLDDEAVNEANEAQGQSDQTLSPSSISHAHQGAYAHIPSAGYLGNPGTTPFTFDSFGVGDLTSMQGLPFGPLQPSEPVQPSAPVQPSELPQPEPLIPTYKGFIADTTDALVVAQLALEGALPMLHKRPSDDQRKYIVRSGHYYCYEKYEANIARWTDDKNWSPSRSVCGNFLVYRETIKSRGGQKVLAKKPVGKSRRNRSSSSRSIGTPASGGPAPRTQAATNAQTQVHPPEDKQIVGALVDTYDFVVDGWIKRTFTMRTRGGGEVHIVGYVKLEHARQMIQDPHCTPSGDARSRVNSPFRNVVPDWSLLDRKSLKNPNVKLEITIPPQGIPNASPQLFAGTGNYLAAAHALPLPIPRHLLPTPQQGLQMPQQASQMPQVQMPQQASQILQQGVQMPQQVQHTPEEQRYEYYGQDDRTTYQDPNGGLGIQGFNMQQPMTTQPSVSGMPHQFLSGTLASQAGQDIPRGFPVLPFSGGIGQDSGLYQTQEEEEEQEEELRQQWLFFEPVENYLCDT